MTFDEQAPELAVVGWVTVLSLLPASDFGVLAERPALESKMFVLSDPAHLK
ncbi:hypothetical protein N0M98_03440 [Paenibacillus doosanensis]|uniref:hypothetical protein n=1 Tax=Paenibacillus TaxID=44249 RepID=UPI00201D9C76|nr:MULTISPECIES: hypothetical protein [Paenibacillus]MCS7459186.1 hypothetical protein [Paenibacillus doosanensis]